MTSTRSSARVVSLALGGLLIAGAVGCRKPDACEAGPQGAQLDAVLAAPDKKSFNAALGTHGPVHATEIPCIERAATGISARKARFAATLLVIVRTEDRKSLLEAQQRVAAKTSDPVVWAELVDRLMEAPSGVDIGASVGRSDMVDKAIRFEDGDDPTLQARVRAIGLRAGARAKIPAIDDELRRGLDATDATLIVALDALSSERALADMPRLLAILKRYEAETKSFPQGTFVALVRAIVRAGSPEGDAAARTALSKDLRDLDSQTGARPEMMEFRNAIAFDNEPSMRRFLLAIIRDDHPLSPLAFDALSTQVTAETRVPPGVELVTICIPWIEKQVAYEDKPALTKLIACSHLLYFMKTGANPRTYPRDPEVPKPELVAHGRAWLEACAASKTCPP